MTPQKNKVSGFGSRFKNGLQRPYGSKAELAGEQTRGGLGVALRGLPSLLGLFIFGSLETLKEA